MTPRRLRGAVYARYSSRYQHSIEDQFRAGQEWAEKNNVEIAPQFLLRDEAVSGRQARREALARLKAALEADEIDVVIVVHTSRLFRKMYKALQFVEEEAVERRKRCVFLANGIDTADTDSWKTLLAVCAMVDEQMLSANVRQIQSAQEGLLLAQRVYGSLCYGYRPEPIAGQTTRRGRPASRIAVDSESSAWVRRIFEWWVNESQSMTAIIRRLHAQGVRPPARSQTGRWTPAVIRKLLSNPRYRGCWEYGRCQSQWQSRKDYARQVERPAPLRSRQIEELRLIDDATWFRAQARFGEHHRSGGRRTGAPQSKVLNGLLFCDRHDRPLHVGGPNGGSFVCSTCMLGVDRSLTSYLPRALAVRKVCETLAAALRNSGLAVQDLAAECRQAADEQLQTPGDRNDLERALAEVNKRIQFILDAPGDSPEDQKENRQRLGQLRAQRAELQARKAQAAQPQPHVPSDEEVGQLLEDLAQELDRAATSADPARQQLARVIIVNLTGGRIVLSQQGEARPHGGWLRGTFRLRLLTAAASKLGLSLDKEEGVEVQIEFKEEPAGVRLAERAKALYDEGLLIKEIARRLGVSRNLASRAVARAFAARGESVPDHRLRRKTLAAPWVTLPLYQRIAADVIRLANEGLLLQEIARRLAVDRNVVTRAVAWWHEARGLPVPDGRTRRKSLPVKTERRAG